ncbi:MAG: dienelactone hydrolase family protein [Desulfobacterales bacterium]
MIRFFWSAFLAIFIFIPTIQAADNADHRELLSKHYKLQKPTGKDTITPVSACESLFSTLPKRDRLTMRIYEDAHHLFDMAELPPETTGPLGTMDYNKAAAEAAWIEVTDFLKR